MKRILSFVKIFPVAALSLLAFSGCVRHDGYNVQPQPQVYQFDEDFNDNSRNWVFYNEANNAEASVSGGQLHYTYYPANPGSNTVAISTGASLRNTFDIQTRIRTNNAMGLVTGVSATDYGYSFFIDPNGYFAVYDEGDASHAPVALIDWTASTAVHSDWNDLELRQEGGNWTGYANGTQLFSIAARAFGGDQIGYIVLKGTSGDADYLSVQWQE